MEDKAATSSANVMSQEFLRYEWNTIPWRKLERNVFKLQKRIYQASYRGDTKLVHKLQRLLLNSQSAKLLATRRVTQDNRGRKTAGIDGVTALTSQQRINLVQSMNLNDKPQPTRRVWIPKPGKKEKRPLGIPTITDRAKQALVKLALEPEWEAVFEPNSYGFRPGRSCHDAIEAIFSSISQKNAYVLDADIQGCFDNINHNALLAKLNTFPKLRNIIQAWLKAGVMKSSVFYPTNTGTPQGGVISPLLANIALHGLERDTKEALSSNLFQWAKTNRKGDSRQRSKRTLSIIRYADDFVAVHQSLEIVKACQEYITQWLKTLGLELKPSKTRICHTFEKYEKQEPGFNFLGFNIRQYKVSKHNSGKKSRGFKTLIKPSKKAQKNHLKGIKDTLRNLRGAPQSAVISQLNPIVKGWSRYYCTVISRKTFERMKNLTHFKLWKWAKFRHSHKGEQWVKRKYFRQHGGDQWRFMTPDGTFLIKHDDHKIVRHTKVKGDRSPYDGNFTYWAARMGKYPLIQPRIAELLKAQKGQCTHCGYYFRPGDIMEVHHQDGNHKNNVKSNLCLIHGHCHDDIHGKGVNVNQQIVEEPCDSKGTRTVLKPSMGGDSHA